MMMSSLGIPALAAAASIEKVIRRAASSVAAVASSKNGVTLEPSSFTQGVWDLVR